MAAPRTFSTPAGSDCARRSSSASGRPMSPQLGQSPIGLRRVWQLLQWTSNAPWGLKRSSDLASAIRAARSATSVSLAAGQDHGLLLDVALERLDAVLLAEPRLLDPAERQLVVRDLDVVDPGVARVELLRGAARLGHVL